MSRNYGDRRLAGIAVGTPGPLELPAGILRNPPNLQGWDGFNLKAAIARTLGREIVLENDADLAAFAEQQLGAGKRYGVADLCVITLGTGVGNGLVLDGKIGDGANGMAGEAGHMVVKDEEALECGCGGRGCLEQYASGTGVARLARMRLGDKAPSTAFEVALLARSGNQQARSAFQDVGHALAIALTGLINTLNLSLYLLGGGLCDAWDIFRLATIRLTSFLALGFLSGCAQYRAGNVQTAPALMAPGVTYLQNSKDAIQTLQTWYEPSTGLYRTTGWWNSANAITVLVDYARVSKSMQYDSLLANTFTAAQKTSPGFLNKYYDDEGWWALAWIDAYDLTANKDYLSMAESIFADMAGSWDDTCGGGIWWSKDKDYKNAIANELFLSVAAHLVNRTAGSTRSTYLEWSNREWKWFQASGMINDKNLINDGIGKGGGQSASTACTNNGRTTWTYNQGVVLGGLAELFSANHDATLRESAQKIAMAAITQLVDTNGILHDPCEPKCGADGAQFKGIFVRNLVLLNQSHPENAYGAFIVRNADTLWKNARGPNFQLSERWSGPFDSGNAARQTSALDALVGAAAINSKEKARGPVRRGCRLESRGTK